MLNRLQLSILVSAIIGGLWLSASATAAPQRRRSAVPLQTPNAATTNALDTLGLYQPESIRSILLLYLARNLPKAKVSQLEADVRNHPDNIDDRLSLIGYYNWNGKTAVDRVHLR